MTNNGKATGIRFYFDDFVVERDNFRVTKGGASKQLTPRAFDLLVYLMERRGRVVEKQEIFEAIWKETFVTDNALMRAVKEIRGVLGDNANAPRYLETVHKRGYRFIADVSENAPTSEPPSTDELNAAGSRISDDDLVISETEPTEKATETRIRRPKARFQSEGRRPDSRVETIFLSLCRSRCCSSSARLSGTSPVRETQNRSNRSPFFPSSTKAATRKSNIYRTG
jgi:DNA-binding winged helix-turn-helix (wHTH) protein